jgi:hypothetical protein
MILYEDFLFMQVDEFSMKDLAVRNHFYRFGAKVWEKGIDDNRYLM